MRIIDETYFKGALSIPNIEKDIESFLSAYVDVYEKEILIHLLGFNMYNDLMDAMEGTLSPKWERILDGDTYNVTINSTVVEVEWIGLRNDQKISLIAYYVYFNYVQQNYQQLTGLGVINSNAENAEKISPNTKLVWAWNQCRNLAGLYPCPLKYVSSFSYTSDENTLFNLLVNNIEDYPKLHYKPVEEMNVLNI